MSDKKPMFSVRGAERIRLRGNSTTGNQMLDGDTKELIAEGNSAGEAEQAPESGWRGFIPNTISAVLAGLCLVVIIAILLWKFPALRPFYPR